jgi:tRNA 2-thiouridine synthesizing protein A
MTVELDTSGLKCPLPVLKTKKALRALDSGELIRVTATDPAALDDFPAYCATAGHELVESRSDGAAYIFVIRKK